MGKSSTKPRKRATQKRHTAARTAANKGWETRRKREREAAKLAKKRSAAARKGWETRRESGKKAVAAAKAQKRVRVQEAKEQADQWLRGMLQLKAEGAGEEAWVPAREAWQEAKRELYRAVDEDFDRYADILEDIADDNDCDWHIAYGPEAE